MYPFYSEWIFCRRKTGTFSFYIVFKGYIVLRRTSFNGFGVKEFYFIPLFCKTGTSCLGYILDRRNINICKPSSRPRTVSPPL